MSRDLSPEERLLRLIKQPPKTKAAEPQELKPQPPVAPVAARNLDPFKITVIALVLFLIAGIFYFSSELFSKKQKYSADIEQLIPKEDKAVKPSVEPAKDEEKQEPPPDSEEEAEPQIKELFGAPSTRETPSIAEGPSISDMAKDLTLLGVITGDNPQAIIEDKRSRQTFYVYENESVSQFKVKKIEKAAVVLEYNGETFKLML